MPQRPLVIAFDVIETLFPLEPMRARLERAGQPGWLLELWFARILRDGFALAAAGGFRPFGEVAASALASVTPGSVGPEQITDILSKFGELDPHPDTAAAVRTVHDAGMRAITLTNGSAVTTAELLLRAGLAEFVERVVSIDEVQRWKPAPQIYLHAAELCGVRPNQMAMVAAHGWDVHGARRAGLTTAWVNRLQGRPDVFDPADVSGADLVSTVTSLLALPSSG